MDTSRLQNMDYIGTTSLMHPISAIIRARTSGKWFDRSIATHVGLAIELEPGEWYVAEMLKKGLVFSKISKYYNKGVFKPKIVWVKRNPIYNLKIVRQHATKRLFFNHAKGIKYDFKGIAEYILPFIRDKEEDFFCSELINHYAIQDGSPIRVGDDDCTPYDIQTCGKLLTIY
jgi:hypothetical protein